MKLITPNKALVICWICFFRPNYGSAQIRKIDSLSQQIQTKNITVSSLHLYRELAVAYFQEGQTDSALIIYQRGLRKSEQISSAYWQAKYLLWTGGTYMSRMQFDSADLYLNKSLPLIEKLQNDSLKAQYYQNKGTAAMFQNKYEQAAELMIRSISVMEPMKEKAPASILMAAYTNLSGIFNEMKQHEKALTFDKKAIAYIHSNATERKSEYSTFYFNHASTYFQLKDLRNYKHYLDSASYFQKLYPNSRSELNILGAYGSYYDEINQDDSALFYMQQALQISKETGDLYFFTEQAYNISKINIEQKKYAQALTLLRKALPYAQEFSDYKMLGNIYNALKEIASVQKNFQQAFEYSELSRRYLDSAASIETKNTVISLEAKYENERKESEIATLQLSNKEKELIVLKRNRLLLIGGLTASALLLLLGLLYRNSQQKRVISEKDKLLHEERIKFLERQQQIVSLQSMVNGQETERTRIAKDLHDGLGGLFSTVKMHLGTLQHENQELRTNPLFVKSYELINTASEEVRRIAHNMMPEVLLKMGVVQATQELCNSISAGKLLNVSMQSYGMEQRLNASTEIMLYRIIQELLNNIMKHAQATEVIVQFNRESNRLTVTVEDNGRGFNLSETDGKNHAGLSSVESRVQYLNGQLSIDSQKEIGTTVLMDFLINEQQQTSQ